MATRLDRLATLEPQSARETLTLWRPTDLRGVELMVAQHSGRTWRVFHETYAICAIPPSRHGPVDFAAWRYRGRDYMCRPGGVSVMEPGETHVNTRVQGTQDFWVLFLDPAYVQSVAAELALPVNPHVSRPQVQSRALVEAFARFYDALSTGEVLEREIRLAACVADVFRICGERPCAPAPREHASVRLAREYLHAHFTEAIHLDDLARVSGLSRFHLAHAFKRAYGLSPHAYQNHLRVAEARRQLRGGVPLHLVDVGFYDQSHLGRYFKRSVGVTPGRYVAATATSPLPRLAN